jgi:dihydrofolate synthase / folylpolyglutamate synthase
VGTTLSPHVHRFNERVRIDGRQADDATLCAAFAKVDEARGEIPLTYFEFSALVALECFRAAAVDVAVLEVGLGGRLDAFNLVAADVAVVTSIGLDHQAFLGDDVETIGREKAGVFRRGQRVVLGADVTVSVMDAAAALDCQATRCSRDFHVRERADDWDYDGRAGTLEHLPASALAPHNCALAIEAASHFVTLEPEQVRQALAGLTLAGRFERHCVGPDQRLMLVDVAHNPAGAAFLRRLIETRHPNRRFVGLFGMLDDKDAQGVVDAMDGLVHSWICIPTHGPRGTAAAALMARIAPVTAQAATVASAADAAQGLERALASCAGNDGVLAFGSFNVVEQMRDLLGRSSAATAALAGGA